MLAASPSLSPSPLKYSASRNGQSRSSSSSYQRSPLFTATATQRSPNTAPGTSRKAAPKSPSLRSSHRDGLTQDSPMTEAVPQPPVIKLTEQSQIESAEESLSAAAAIVAPTGQAHSKDSQIQHASPSIKRRQPKESVDADAPLTRAQDSPSKRPKTSKPTAKVLPNRYEFCGVEDLVILIADMISELIETNDNLPLRDTVLTRFHSRTAPGISVKDYLQRLAKHAALTPPLLLSMVYYIDRLCSLYPAFTITTLTVHRFLITAATVAAKGLSDSFWNNSTYARVGGIKLAELGMLELEFLYRVDWRIVPNPEVLIDYYHGLVGRTEEYVLESDVVSRDLTENKITPSETTGPEDSKSRKQDITDTKWNEWMRDVADNSAEKAKKDPA